MQDGTAKMIALCGVTVRQETFVLSDISFAIPTGMYGVLMGKTGSGKTTLLEVIAGLRHSERGAVRLGELDVTNCSPADRQLGYVPQDRALFRTMTVADHLAFGPRVRKWRESDVQFRVRELASQLGLTPLLKRFPNGLSGGESARVALGRALSYRPAVLLLDEPLSGRDDDTRDEVIELLKSIRDQRMITVLHITHSRYEAERLADVRLELRNGIVHTPTTT